MVVEVLLLVGLALFSLIAVAFTVIAWVNAPQSRGLIVAKLIWYGTALPVNVFFLFYTWHDGLDYVHQMGSISLQAVLMFFAILINVVHYYEVKGIGHETKKAT